MDDSLKLFEKEIVKTHKFGFTPKFETEFSTRLSEKAFIQLAMLAFEKLNWDLMDYDDNSIVAKRKVKNFGLSSHTYTELIIAKLENGSITVSSESIKSSFWDNGMNSKRVLLFKYVLQEFENTLDTESIRRLETERDRIDNW